MLAQQHSLLTVVVFSLTPECVRRPARFDVRLEHQGLLAVFGVNRTTSQAAHSTTDHNHLTRETKGQDSPVTFRIVLRLIHCRNKNLSDRFVNQQQLG